MEHDRNDVGGFERGVQDRFKQTSEVFLGSLEQVFAKKIGSLGWLFEKSSQTCTLFAHRHIGGV